MKFAANGKFLASWGTPGKGRGEFDLPHSICIDKQGRVLVGDRENDRVQVFTADGKLLVTANVDGGDISLVDRETGKLLKRIPVGENPEFVHRVAKTNVQLTMADISRRRSIITGMEDQGQLAIAGALYDMKTGASEFLV